jgi:hypothetical protein
LLFSPVAGENTRHARLHLALTLLMPLTLTGSVASLSGT